MLTKTLSVALWVENHFKLLVAQCRFLKTFPKLPLWHWGEFECEKKFPPKAQRESKRWQLSDPRPAAVTGGGIPWCRGTTCSPRVCTPKTPCPEEQSIWDSPELALPLLPHPLGLRAPAMHTALFASSWLEAADGLWWRGLGRQGVPTHRVPFWCLPLAWAASS